MKLKLFGIKELHQYQKKRLKVLPQVQFEVELDWLREQRNRLLRETDFYALPDVTMSDEMKTYRQKLRDITKGLTTVEEIKAVTMPTKP